VATAETRTIDVDGQRIGVAIKRGDGVPLLIFNDLGANLKLLDPSPRARMVVVPLDLASEVQALR
jgi:hypothetical protein